MSKKIFRALGLMSGTSMDGIDAAIITTDGYKILETGVGQTFPYTELFREKIRHLINGKGDLHEVTLELTKLHARAVEELLYSSGEDKNSIDLIGFHGHTIDHRPHDGVTIQIGDGKLLSELTGISVVNDFRSADVQSGGQGAPLVPIFHQALMASQIQPVAVVNIGGVANVTWVGGGADELLAFDTGPGNALLDDWMRAKTDKSFDENGALAKSGVVDEILLTSLLQNDYFSVKPPKSLDRNHFSTIPENYKISPEDGAATLTAFTAESIALAAKYFPKPVNKWLIAGGGRHNSTLMEYLKSIIKEPVINIDDIDIDGDMLEAQAFAFLAVRSILRLSISFPGTTGVKSPVTGGVLQEPNE